MIEILKYNTIEETEALVMSDANPYPNPNPDPYPYPNKEQIAKVRHAVGALMAVKQKKAELKKIETDAKAQIAQFHYQFGKGKVIDTTATLKTIDNLIKNTGVGGTKSLWREIKRDIKGKGIGPLDEIRKKLMKRIDKTDPSRHGYDVSQGLRKIESVLRNDIGTAKFRLPGLATVVAYLGSRNTVNVNAMAHYLVTEGGVSSAIIKVAKEYATKTTVNSEITTRITPE